jgi:NAD(P)H-flavin reductase
LKAKSFSPARNSIAPYKDKDLEIPEMTATAPAAPMTPTFVRVEEFTTETSDTFTIRLEPPANYSFAPGQFNMLYAFGVGEAAISLSGDPGKREIIHTIRAVGSVTNVLMKARPGAQIGVRGPFGSQWPVDASRGHDVVLVCGGIGLAPLRPVIYHLLNHRADYGKVALLLGARSPADLLYRSELEAWSKRADFQVLVSVDRPDPAWRGGVGLVTSLFSSAQFDPARTIGLTCGPEIMMRFVQREFAKRGVADDRVYLSLERNMQCAIGFCGHCQFGPEFVCMNGPVFRYDGIKRILDVREI